MNVLQSKLLWWRHAWFFNWAHKPLCSAYREDTIRVGSLRLCRGCTALWSGVLIGGPLLWLALPIALQFQVFWITFLPVAALSHPALHSRWPRPLRDLSRFASGTLATLALAQVIAFGSLQGGLALSALLGTYWLYKRIRSDRRLDKCSQCPEVGQGICSGYELQASAIRVWEEQAAEIETARRLRGLS